MGEVESNILEFDLNDLEEDMLDFDLEETDDFPAEYDLNDEIVEGLEFIDIEPKRKAVEVAFLSIWRRRMAIACACLSVVGALITLWLAGSTIAAEYQAERKVEALRREQQRPVDTTQDQLTVILPTVVMPEEDLPENPYADAFSQNEDMAAWLTAAGTKIDYPVMLTLWDEEYYLYRDFYGNEDQSGSLLFDTDSELYGDGVTSNLIIHGHNMRVGTMFGELDLYQDANYEKEHEEIELYTRTELRRYQVIAVFYSQIYYASDDVFKYYDFFRADTEEEFRYFYDHIKEMSLYDTGVEAELGDQFLTLSTCSYQTQDGRFVVVAKEIDRNQTFAPIED